MTHRFTVVPSWALATLVFVVLSAMPAMAQQDKGDREVGLGGQAFFTHSTDFTGDMFAQISFGYFASKKTYLGVEADPLFNFSHDSSGSHVSVGGFFSGSVRRFFRDTGKIYPFVGGGGGGYLQGGSGGNSAQGLVFAEVGVKDYLSQKTSLELAYRFNYLPSSSGGFSEQTLSQLVISIRHIF
jgi:hypothetical protein